MAINKRKVLDSARRHAQKGAKQKALREYGKLIAADPRDAKLLLEMGDVHRRWGQIDDAVNQYAKVVSRYREEGFDARAVAVLKQILALDPKRYDSRVDLAELYQRMGLDSDALVAYQAAADGFYKEGQRKRAVEILQRMVSLDSGNTTSRLKVADLLWQEGLSSESISEFQGAADELARQGVREEAMGVRERILEIAPDHVPTLSALATELIEIDEFERARPLAQKALELERDGEHFDLLCRIHKELGEDGPLADLTREMADHYRSRGDEAKAREVMQRLPGEVVLGETGIDTLTESQMDLSGLENGRDPGQGNGAFILDSLEEGEDLEAVGAEASRQLAEEDFIVDEEARVETPAELPDEPDFDMVVDEAEAPDLEQRLAESRVYLRYGKYDEARGCLQDLTQTDADHPMVWQQLARVFSECGEKEEALKAFNKALSLAQDMGSMSVAFELEQEIGDLGDEDGSSEENLLVEVGASDALMLDEPITSSAVEEGVEFVDEGEVGAEIEFDLAGNVESDDEALEPSGPTVAFDFSEDSPATLELAVEDHWGQREGEVETSLAIPVEADAHAGHSLIFHEEARKTVEEMTDDLFMEPDTDEEALETSDAGHESVAVFELDVDLADHVEEEGESDTPDSQDDDEEGEFDLAAELAGVFEEVENEVTATQVFGDTTLGEGMRSLFSDFKQGVSDTLGEGDAETRFDLAIAYREMELFEDAAAEFQICTGVASRRLESLHMLGLCVLELGRADEAKSHIEQALALPDVAPNQEAALRFDLGRIEMALGAKDEARRCFDAVATLDPRFPGLAQALMDPASAGDASSPDGYESFDDLFSASDASELDEDTTSSESGLRSEDAQNEVDLSEATAEEGRKSRSGRRKRISFI
ncbi:MAG: tetratricopeptide repeat protein [Myxococcota bacterium]|nr:tetratricopeptide repeat protein [Myxococcota bacterium]